MHPLTVESELMVHARATQACLLFCNLLLAAGAESGLEFSAVAGINSLSPLGKSTPLPAHQVLRFRYARFYWPGLAHTPE